MEIHTIGIELGKTVFHLVGDSGDGQPDGAHGLGGADQRRSLSPSAVATNCRRLK